MDIRNIKYKPAAIRSGLILHEMFELSRKQMDGYKEIENLPDWPFSINTASNQVILKDFIGRVIEELSEGWESIQDITDLMRATGWNSNILSIKSRIQLQNHIQNANEEQADALGFFFALLTFSNIDESDIASYLESKDALDSEDYLDINNIIVVGMKWLYTDCNIWDEIDYHHGYDLIHQSDFNDVTKFLEFKDYAPGFHNFSETLYDANRIALWVITHNLNIARNLLKNRPWKRSQVMTKEIDYQEALVKSFILYLGYLGMNIMGGDQVYTLFYKKVHLNLWRQHTNY